MQKPQLPEVPIGENGLVVPPDPDTDCGKTECPWYERDKGCHTDTHHLYWPEDSYKKSSIAKTFRELPEAQVTLCRWQHDEYHATYNANPPASPTVAIMKEVIRESDLLALLQVKIRNVQDIRTQISEATEDEKRVTLIGIARAMNGERRRINRDLKKLSRRLAA